MAKKAKASGKSEDRMDQKQKETRLSELLKKIQSADTPSHEVYGICNEFFNLEPKGEQFTQGFKVALECVKMHKMPARHPCDDGPRSLHDIVHLILRNESLKKAIYKHTCTSPEERFGYFACIIEMPAESNRKHRSAIFREFDQAVAEAHSESIMAGAITLIFQLSTDEAYDKVCATLAIMDEENCDSVLRAIEECNEHWSNAGKRGTFENALFKYCCKGLDSKEVHLAVTRIADLRTDAIRFQFQTSRIAMEVIILHEDEVVVSVFAKLISMFYRADKDDLYAILRSRVEMFQDPSLKADMERLLTQ